MLFKGNLILSIVSLSMNETFSFSYVQQRCAIFEFEINKESYVTCHPFMLLILCQSMQKKKVLLYTIYSFVNIYDDSCNLCSYPYFLN